MARLVGTGKDPLGRYGEGLVFDVPVGDKLYDELLGNGFAEELDDDRASVKDVNRVAAEIVRGGFADNNHPRDEAIAEQIEDAHAVVHSEGAEGVAQPASNRKADQAAVAVPTTKEVDEDDEPGDKWTGVAYDDGRAEGAKPAQREAAKAAAKSDKDEAAKAKAK